MQSASESVSNLAAALWPATGSVQALRAATFVIAGSLFVACAAQIQVPLKPVPVTMQTFAVLVVGMAYGARLGAAALALYLVEGAAGLPVFAGHSAGPAILVGPTGGYLIGFIGAAGLVGWLAERGWDRRASGTAAAMVLGNLVIYVLGLGWLASLVGMAKAIEFGLLPFLFGDGLKMLLAAAVLPLAWTLVERFRTSPKGGGTYQRRHTGGRS